MAAIAPPPAPPPAAAPPGPAPNLAPPSDERGNVPNESAAPHEESLGEAFADLDKAFGEPAREPSAPPPTSTNERSRAPENRPPGQPPRAPDGKFLPRKDDAPPAAKPPEPTPEPPIEKMAPPELRKAYAELRKKHATLEEERQKAAAAPPAQPQDDPEKKTLTERLAEREARLQKLEEEFKYTAYEKSEEYREKYEQPFISAWTAGQDKAARLKVVAQTDELGDEVQAARQGTVEDFNTLMAIGDDDEAADWAAKTFGSKAPYLLYHRERVQEANGAKFKALEDYRAKAGERDKQRQEQFNNHTKLVRDLYHKTKEAGIEKYSQFFKADPNDPKTKTLLDKGMRLADRALGAPDAEGETPLTGEEKVKLQAAMRNCFGGFQRLAYSFQKEQRLRQELEKKVAEYEASEPRGGDGRGGGRIGGGAADDAEETPEGAFNARFGT